MEKRQSADQPLNVSLRMCQLMAEPSLFESSEPFIEPKSIPSEIRRRLSTDDLEKISPKLLGDYEANGWVLDTQLKKQVKVRRPKSHDRAFEDRVWAVMAKLNITILNKDRSFRLPYGQGQNELKQIDVFAADDEMVLVIECKSSDHVVTNTFKTEVEAIQGTKPGLIRTIKTRFPDHKIKFILATNNIGMTNPTRDRIEAADIAIMDDDSIDYYFHLADHLGKAAKYQLLGSLFAGSKIPGLDATVPAIQAKMGGYTYYSFAIEPARLLKLGYILHRNRANSQLMPTYQRLIRKTRLKRISEFVEDGGFFPNSIVLNIDGPRRGIRFDRVSQSDGGAKLGLLHLPQTYRAAYVIDGQHRLYGYADSDRADKDLIPVVAFVGLPRAEQVRLFMQINENQQAVPKNLRNTLNADLLWDSEDLRESARALKLRIAQQLGESKYSPLFGRVIIGENTKSPERCITIDAISIGLDRSNFIGTFTKTELREPGTFYRGSNQSTFDALVPFLEFCFQYLRDELPEQWSLANSDGGFVFINNGVESLIRIFSDIVDHLSQNEQINPRECGPDDLFEYSQVYLDPLISFLSQLDFDEGVEFRRQYGTAGRTRYWRQLQIVIHNEFAEFNPLGLEDFLKEEEKQFNTESFEMIRDIEQLLKRDIRERLENGFGERWTRDGIPKKVFLDATTLAAQKNLDREPGDELEPWDCLHLIDYYSVVTYTHALWQEMYQSQYTRPEDEGAPGGWKEKANWMVKLNAIRNEVDHNYAVTEEQYEYLVAIHSWLLGN